MLGNNLEIRIKKGKIFEFRTSIQTMIPCIVDKRGNY
jgi:hypothetical protein